MQDVKIVLEDVFTGSIQDLTLYPTYYFIASKEDNPERFILHFMYSPDEIGEDFEHESEIQIYSYGKQVYIRSSKEAINQNGNVLVYDLMGRKIVQQQISRGELIKLNINTTNNYVIVKVVKEGFIKTEKVFIK